jgi:hypothetical protein
LTTVGSKIDHSSAKESIDEYFARISELIRSPALSSRMKFALMDVIDLRKNGWRSTKDEMKPKTIEEVHRDMAMKERKATTSMRGLSKPSPSTSVRSNSSRGATPVSGPNDWKTSSGSKQDSKGKTILKRGEEKGASKGESQNKFGLLMGGDPGKKTDDEKEEVATVKKVEQTVAAAERSSKNLIQEYLNHNDLKASVQYLTEYIEPQNFTTFVSVGVNCALEAKKPQVSKVGTLFRNFFDKGLISQKEFISGFQESFAMLDDLVIDIPHCFEYSGILVGHALAGEIFSLEIVLNDVLKSLKSSLDPLLRVLAAAFSTSEELIGLMATAKLINSCPVSIKDVCVTDKKFDEFLKTNSIELLFPEHSINKKFLALVNSGDIDECTKFCTNHFTSNKSTESLKLLLTPVFDHIFSMDNEGKEVEKFFSLFQAVVDEHLDLQSELLNVLTEVWLKRKEHQKDAMFKYVFQSLYEQEVVFEAAYSRWKDDTSIDKGKALFLVSRWLQWLETAQEESD